MNSSHVAVIVSNVTAETVAPSMSSLIMQILFESGTQILVFVGVPYSLKKYLSLNPSTA